MKTALFAALVLALTGCDQGSNRPPVGDGDADADADTDAGDGCPAGFDRSWGQCIDIDECASGAATCDELARCTNVEGGYTCECPSGYEGDGHTCTEIDECASGADDCGPQAICINEPASFRCECPPGWTGDGYDCVEPCDGRTDCWLVAPGDASPFGVAVDPAGEVLVAARFDSSLELGGDLLTSAGRDDLALARLSAEGDPLWSVGYGGESIEGARALARGANGDAAVVGVFVDTANLGGDDLAGVGGTDAFVASYAPDGAHRWSTGFGSDTGSLFTPEDARGVALDADGNLLVVGTASGPIDLGGGVLDPVGPDGPSDTWFASFTPDGVHRWSARFGGTGEVFAQAVAIDSHGNAFVTGTFGGTANLGGEDLTSAGYLDVFLASYGPDGSHRWSARFGSFREQDDDHTFVGDWGLALATDGDRDVVLAGIFTDQIDLGGEPLVGTDDWGGFVARFTSEGEHRWSRSLGGAGADYANAVAVDEQGHVFVTGSIRGRVDFGGGELPAPDTTNAYVASYDAEGGYRWSRIVGKGTWDTGYSSGTAIAARDGAVIVAGSFDGPMTFEGLEAWSGAFVLHLPDF